MDTTNPLSPEPVDPESANPGQPVEPTPAREQSPSGRERRRTFTRIAVAGGVAAVGLSIGGIAVATADDEGSGEGDDRGPGLFLRHDRGEISDELAERLAESLGIDEDKVAEALEDVRDELGPPKRLEDLRDGDVPSPPTEAEQEAHQDELAAALADALDVDAAEVETALEEIRADVEAAMEERFAEFREQARADLVERLDDAVEEGTLTEADKRSVLKAYDEGVLDGPGFGRFVPFGFGDGRLGGVPFADDEEPSTSS